LQRELKKIAIFINSRLPLVNEPYLYHPKCFL
jgi:hypothetical protein